MAEGKTSISNAGTLREIGEYWDTHDLAEHWDETHEVHFDVELEPSVTYFALDKNLAERLREAAKQHGVSAETLLNVWVQEHVASEPRSK